MRVSAILFFSLLVASSAASGGGQQDSDTGRNKAPKKGDTLQVKGCLRGAMLESTETAGRDGTPLLVPLYTYQLKGKKDLLKELRGKHDGSIVEVTGELKSALDEPRGTQVGRTRIVVGVDSMSRGRPQADDGRVQPVLEVKSFEGSGVSCRR